jgi:hypothetical protein
MNWWWFLLLAVAMAWMSFVCLLMAGWLSWWLDQLAPSFSLDSEEAQILRYFNIVSSFMGFLMLFGLALAPIAYQSQSTFFGLALASLLLLTITNRSLIGYWLIQTGQRLR